MCYLGTDMFYKYDIADEPAISIINTMPITCNDNIAHWIKIK